MSDPEKNYGTDTDQVQNVAEKNSGIDNFWDDPKKIMNLIDLLFLWDDPDRKQVCS
jgi:hypothetical protein